MAEQDIDIVLRARNVTKEAFAEVEKSLGALEGKAKDVGAQSKGLGAGIESFFAANKQSFTAVGQAVGLFAGAVTGAAAAVIALGDRGSAVADIRGQFEALNNAVGTDSTKALGALKTAFAGTVSDFNLMKMANVALSMGLRATDKDFELLGDAARVLADRTGVDAKQAFNDLTKAMATGKTMTAELLVGVIDKERALKEYANTIGVSVKELTKQQEAEATAIVIKERMREAIALAGKAQFDFTDAIDASKAMVQNWTDAVGESIATSPVVVAALMEIQRAMSSSFGVDQEAQVKSITSYVNKFAIWLVDVASAGVSTAKYLMTAWDGIKILFAGVMVVATGIGEAFARVNAVVLEMAAKMPFASDEVKKMAVAARDNATYMEGMRKSFQQQTSEAVSNAGKNRAAFDSVSDTLATMKQKMIAASTAQIETTKSAGPLISKTKEVATEQKTLAQEVQKAALAMTLTKVPVTGMSSDFEYAQKKTWELNKILYDLGRETIPMLPVKMDFLKKGNDAVSEGMKKVSDDAKAQELDLGSLSQAFVNLAQISGGSLASIVQSIGSMIAAIDLADKSMTQYAKGGLSNITAGLVGAASAMMQATSSSNALVAGLGGAMTGMQIGGQIAGPYGAAIGAVAGGVMGLARALFGVSVEEKKARESINKFEESLRGIATASQLAEAGTDDWKVTVIVLRDAYMAMGKSEQEALREAEILWASSKSGTEAAKAAIDKVNEVLDAHKEKLRTTEEASAMLRAATERYKFTVEELGPAMQAQKLHEMSSQLYGDWNLLIASGINIDSVADKMSESAQEYLRIALATGAEVPIAMKPMLEKMAAMGLLTDDSGEKLTDMSAIPWAETMSEGFDRVVAAIDKMIAALGYSVPDAATVATDAASLSAAEIEANMIAASQTTEDAWVAGANSIEANMIAASRNIESAFAADAASMNQSINKIPKDLKVNVYWDVEDFPDIDTDRKINVPGGQHGMVGDFGRGTLVQLHGREAVVPMDRPSLVGSQLIREILQVGSVAAPQVNVDVRLGEIERAVAALGFTVATMPATMTRSLRDALLTSRVH